jgi:hypothetical protein
MLIASTYPACRGGMEDSEETRILEELYQIQGLDEAFVKRTLFTTVTDLFQDRDACDDVFSYCQDNTLQITTNKNSGFMKDKLFNMRTMNTEETCWKVPIKVWEHLFVSKIYVKSTSYLWSLL